MSIHVRRPQYGVLEGSIGALPRRVLVDSERLAQAREILTEAGIGHVIARDHQA
jgi:glycerol dehydrogenase-like iron-containing ADH family enzyme